MPAPLIQDIPLETLTPARLWQKLDRETRALAGLAFYQERDPEGRTMQRGVDGTIARALRFREATVRKLPAEKKAGYLARVVHPDDVLASTLLQALHLGHRRPLLAAFLDQLGVAHQDGVIAPETKLEELKPEAIAAAARGLYDRFPPAEVDLYLASLAAVDRRSWAPVLEVLAAR